MLEIDFPSGALPAESSLFFLSYVSAPSNQGICSITDARIYKELPRGQKTQRIFYLFIFIFILLMFYVFVLHFHCTLILLKKISIVQ